MKSLAAGVFALLVVVQFTGCSRTSMSTTQSSNLNGSRPTVSGIKPVSQVQPCCRAFAEGRIGLDKCMENPACKANNRNCCMQAIQ